MIYNSQDLADQLRVTTRTVRNWMSQGYLKPKGYRLVRSTNISPVFTTVEVEEFLDRWLIKPEDLTAEYPSRNDERTARARRIYATITRYGKIGAASIKAKAKARKIAAETPSSLPLDPPPKPKE